jgi:terminal uridylyltransferase
MRASRILSTRPERAIYAIAQLCEERVEGPVPVTSPTAAFVPPRLSPFPPQTPYTVGSSPMRLTRIDVPDPKSISDVSPKSPPSEAPSAPGPTPSTPDHMAPKRSKWTSPPPPSASASDRSQFESQLGLGLALATLPTDARQMNGGYASSSNNSEILTDDGDDLQSIRSLSLSEVPEHGLEKCNGSPESLPNSSPVPSSPQAPTQSAAADPRQSPVLLGDNVAPLKLPYIVPRDSYPLPVFQSTLPGLRGRSSHHLDFISTSPRLNSPRRSHSGPPGPLSPGISGKPFPLLTLAVMTPLPPSPPPPLLTTQPYVYYETAPSPTIAYPVSPRYPPRFHAAAAAAAASMAARVRLAPSPTATPTAHSQFRARHAHSHSMTTIHARTPSPATETFASRAACGDSVQSTGSTSPPSPPDSLSAGSGSPVPSSLSSQCDAGFDLVRWEESGENGDDGAGATVAAAVAEEEGAKTEEWVVVREKAPPDAHPQPAREPLPP